MARQIQSIERAAAILKLLSSGQRRLGVVELAQYMGLPKGTVHGILVTLTHIGFVEQDRATGKYQLGATVLRLGNSYLDGNELRNISINWADALAARSREAVQIGTRHDGGALIVHHVFRPDDSLQSLEVGTVLPLHSTALGKVLLAFGAEELDDVLTMPLERSASRTTVSSRDLEIELGDIRTGGWAGEVNELVDGQAAIAAPIRDRDFVVGSIGIRGAVERLCEPDLSLRRGLVTFVLDAATAISRELATPSPNHP
ncbi:MAG: IclR family transcriptional regulator [Micrococcales bacterium]|nr:IclR family transcriptional regulator [Micrococcales bacterium]